MENNIYKAPESQLTTASENHTELASRVRRLVAAFIDGLTIGLVTLPLMYFTGGFAGISTGEQPSFLYSLGIGLIGIVIYFAINWNFLSSAGQTIGKKVMSIKVVTLDDQLPTMSNHFLKRYAVYFLPGQIPVAGQGFSIVNILFIFGPQRRCIHDFFAGTKVVSCS